MKEADVGVDEMHITGRGTGETLCREFTDLISNRKFTMLGIAIRSVASAMLAQAGIEQPYEFDAYAKVDGLGEPMTVEVKVTLSRVRQ